MFSRRAGVGPEVWQGSARPRTVKHALGAIHQLISQDLHAREPEPEVDEELATTLASDETDIELWTNGPIRNRTDAYRRLSEAADYLLRTEPHSPTPYLVKRAVEWGNMSLPELLQQIVRNEGELSEIDRLLRLTGKRWPT